MLATPDTRLTPRSPARITVRRATSHADPKAAATDGHRNLAAALRDNARDATQVLPCTGHHKPVNQTVRHVAQAPGGLLAHPIFVGLMESRDLGEHRIARRSAV
jgi:hypothetical protein